MTNEERIAKAKEKIDFLWGETEYWLKKEGYGSPNVMLWNARWVAAKEIYELLIGERYE